jgi:hypothetical protein
LNFNCLQNWANGGKECQAFGNEQPPKGNKFCCFSHFSTKTSLSLSFLVQKIQPVKDKSNPKGGTSFCHHNTNNHRILTFCHPPFISFLASPFPWHYPFFCLFASSSPSIPSFLYPTAAIKGAVPLPIDWVGQSGEAMKMMKE